MADLLAGTRSVGTFSDSAAHRAPGPDGDTPDTDGVFVPFTDPDTAYLLSGSSRLGSISIVDTGSAQLIDEAAILYANHQNEIVEQMLHDGIVEDRLDSSTRSAWLMLLDLYRLTGRLQSFEELAVAYAAKFETSPPPWQDLTLASASPMQPDSRTPVVIFSGKLDGTIKRHLTRIQELAESHPSFRLELHRVTSVDPIGCGLLLRTLQRIRKPEFNLIMAGAAELAGRIRSILQVGRRDETEAPWLLLLDILRVLGRESEFDEVSMDYCVTFEVSPPPFSTPDTLLILANDSVPAAEAVSAAVTLPPVVDGKVTALLDDIAYAAAVHQPLTIDCSRLIRVEFGAAGQLVDALAPLCANGVRIEFHEVNHLVAALFRVIGLEALARVLVRRT